MPQDFNSKVDEKKPHPLISEEVMQRIADKCFTSSEAEDEPYPIVMGRPAILKLNENATRDFIRRFIALTSTVFYESSEGIGLHAKTCLFCNDSITAEYSCHSKKSFGALDSQLEQDILAAVGEDKVVVVRQKTQPPIITMIFSSCLRPTHKANLQKF